MTFSKLNHLALLFPLSSPRESFTERTAEEREGRKAPPWVREGAVAGCIRMY